VGLTVFGGAFGAGTALATAQSTTPPSVTTPTTQATSPTTNAKMPHGCPHHNNNGAGAAAMPAY
jgi:hypothetical protein